MKKKPKQLNEIAEQQYEALFRYCRKRADGDEQLARESTAEAFLRAKTLGDPPQHPNISGWLRRTAGNILHERLREKKEYYSRNISLEELDGDGRGCISPFFERECGCLEEFFDEGSEDIDDEQVLRIKRDILSLLPPSDQELMELRYEIGLSLSEIAERTGRSKDAVRVKLSRLTDKVTEMVRNYFTED